MAVSGMCSGGNCSCHDSDGSASSGARLHAHEDRLLGLAAVDALVRRHVGEIAADGHLDEMLVGQAVVGRVDADPAQVGQPGLAPGVALRFLVRADGCSR